MRLKFIGILLLLPLISRSQNPPALEGYQPTLAKVEATYQAGDRFLAAAKLDSALAAYLQARTGINDLFFMLINAKKRDSLPAGDVTRRWDLVMSKMQVKIDSLTDCEFDRCLIYREEKAANWCIQILKTGEPGQPEQLLSQLIVSMDQDAKSQLKNFFSKIKSWVEIEVTWLNFQKLQNPEAPANAIEAAYHRFLEAFSRYREQIS